VSTEVKIRVLFSSLRRRDCVPGVPRARRDWVSKLFLVEARHTLVANARAGDTIRSAISRTQPNPLPRNVHCRIESLHCAACRAFVVAAHHVERIAACARLDGHAAVLRALGAVGPESLCRCAVWSMSSAVEAGTSSSSDASIA
jgi:hypothetical protein